MNLFWGKMDGGDIDLGNERGKNSFVENGFQGGDLTPGGGGAKIKFMKHLPNALSYLQKGLRDVTGAIDQYNNMRSVFDTEHAEIDNDAVFNNPITPFELNHNDSLRIQDSRNSLPDSVFGYSYYKGYLDGTSRRLGTGTPSKKDSLRHDSIVRNDVYINIRKLKKKMK